MTADYLKNNKVKNLLTTMRAQDHSVKGAHKGNDHKWTLANKKATRMLMA